MKTPTGRAALLLLLASLVACDRTDAPADAAAAAAASGLPASGASSTPVPGGSPAAGTPAPTAVTTPGAAVDPAVAAWVVGPSGAGRVRFGMTLEEALAASPAGLEPLGPAEVECRYVVPSGAPKGLAIMVVEDRVVRVDVQRDSAATTTLGIRAGDPEARAKELLGPSTEVTPHKYVDGHYLTAPTGEGDTFWVVETDGGVVTDVRSGLMPQVRWVEGCS